MTDAERNDLQKILARNDAWWREFYGERNRIKVLFIGINLMAAVMIILLAPAKCSWF
jgi:hypothetical protein